MAEHPVPLIGGTYRHYKGGLYTVLHVATQEGSKERMVVYRGPDGRIWIRPLYQWFSSVQPNAGDRTTVPRFVYEAQPQSTSGATP